MAVETIGIVSVDGTGATAATDKQRGGSLRAPFREAESPTSFSAATFDQM